MFADFLITAVRTSEANKQSAGISLLAIPRTTGVSTRKMKMQGSAAAGTAYVTLEEVVVPADHLIGKEGDGLKIILSNFNHEVCCVLLAMY